MSVAVGQQVYKLNFSEVHVPHNSLTTEWLGENGIFPWNPTINSTRKTTVNLNNHICEYILRTPCQHRPSLIIKTGFNIPY